MCFLSIIIYILLIISNTIINNYLVILTLFIICMLMMKYLIFPNNNYSIKNIISFIFLRVLIYLCINLFFSWLFNIPFITSTYHYFFSYTLLVNFIERYILFIFTSYHSNNILPVFRNFKIISILLFIYLCITILYNNNALFYFPDVGRTFIFVVIVSIASLIFFDRYQVKHEIIEREQAITTQNILKEKEYLNKYNDSIDEIRTMRHDMHNTLHIIHGYLEAEQTSEATEYVSHLLGIMNNSSALVHVGIPCIDSVFDDKLKMMNKKNIKYTEHIAHVNIGCIERNSLAILIGLALDNAIEAAEKVEHNRFIKVEMKNSQQYLILRITNSIILGTRPNFYKTSKLTDSMNHGFGVKEIKHIASQYNGDVKYKTNDDNVILKVILNISEKEDQS